MVGYTVDIDPETSARAIGREMSVSPKHSIVICRHIKGFKLERAKAFLGEVIKLKTPVPDTRYGSSGHRRGKVGPGRYPQKAARHILKVLEGAEANAEYKGLVIDDSRAKRIARGSGRKPEQVMDLVDHGVQSFHLYTLNRADLAYAICHLLGLRPVEEADHRRAIA